MNPNVKEGQVVVIKQKLLPRYRWKLGKVVRTICSQDGVVKGAELHTENGMLKRPLKLLCPIEMEPNKDEINPTDTTIPEIGDSQNDLLESPEVRDDYCESEKNESRGSKSCRLAAITGELKRRLCTE